MHVGVELMVVEERNSRNLPGQCLSKVIFMVCMFILSAF